MAAGTPSRFSFLSFIFLFVFLGVSSIALAETKLGLALKQGYDYPYISEIDPKGIGAASGFMRSDHIKEIGSVSIWFTRQAERFLKYNLKKNKPFTVMVERDGSLQQVIVDVNKAPLSFPDQKGSDPLSNCFFSPNAGCIERFITTPDQSKAGVAISHYRSNIRTIVQLGEIEKARIILDEMKAFFYNNPDTVRYYTSSVLDAMKDLKETPDQRFRDFVYQHADRKKASDLLGAAVIYKDYGAPKLGKKLLNDALQMLASDPKSLGIGKRSLGRSLAAYGMHEKLRAFIIAKDYKSEDKNAILEAALIYHVGRDDMKSANTVMNIILKAPRSWTDKDTVHYVRLFNKLHFLDQRQNMLSQLIKQYDDAEGKFHQPILRASLVRALGASGQIHRGRTYIEKGGGDPLHLMMSLAIEAANSKSAHGIAVQFYKDFPALITDTYALLKSKTPEQRQKLNKSTLRDFYIVLASYLPVNPSIRELDGLRFDKYRYGPIIDQYIEVRKYGTALKWTDDVEKRFGQTYKYGDIFSALGGIASLKDINQFTRHPKFGEYKNRFHRQFLDRLYWKGRINEARTEFNQLDEKHKRSAIHNQVMFITPCQSCNL